MPKRLRKYDNELSTSANVRFFSSFVSLDSPQLFIPTIYMPLVNTGADAVRLILQRILRTTPLPALVPLKNDTTWRTHTSYVGATHYPFEAPEGEGHVDYERLEVRPALDQSA